MDAEFSTPLDRISALEFKAAQLENIIFGDERTRTESLFARMDKLQASIDQMHRRQAWMLATLLFVVGITSAMLVMKAV